MPVATAPSGMVARHVPGDSREVQRGHPPTICPQEAPSHVRSRAPGSRAEGIGGGGYPDRAGRAHGERTKLCGSERAGGAEGGGGSNGGGGPAAPRPRHVVRGGQPSCYKHKHRGAAAAGAPAPPPPQPPPARRAPPACRRPRPTIGASRSPPARRVCLLLTGSCSSSLCYLTTRTKRRRSVVESTKESCLCHSLAGWEELWSLEVDGHCVGTPVQPHFQPLRESLHSPKILLSHPFLRTTRDELPPETLLC